MSDGYAVAGRKARKPNGADVPANSREGRVAPIALDGANPYKRDACWGVAKR
jgi:hypothetical protein